MRERMPRTWNYLSEETVKALVLTAKPEVFGTGGLANGPHMPAFSEDLTDKRFALQFENRSVEYYFMEKHRVLWKWNDGIWYEGYCQYAKSEDGIYFVQHTCFEEEFLGGMTLVLDFNNGRVTAIEASFGNYRAPREIERQFLFGRISGVENELPLHDFTEDLVGKAILWSYHPHMDPIKHVYTSPLYYTYVMRSEHSEWIASNPADYVKISDNLYLVSFLEERQTGIQGSFLINTKTLTDVGSFFGINGSDQFECYLVGAKGEWVTGEYRI